MTVILIIVQMFPIPGTKNVSFSEYHSDIPRLTKKIIGNWEQMSNDDNYSHHCELVSNSQNEKYIILGTLFRYSEND